MKKTTTKPEAPKGIVLPKLDLRRIEILLIGDSPLICHAWSEKAKKQMLDKQMKRASTAKEAKDPQRDYEESLYRLPDGGFGFPAVGFKNAVVDACSFVDAMTKVSARGAFHITDEFVRIAGEPSMRQDMVKIAMGTADVRFRGQFEKWRASVTVTLNVGVVSAEQLVNLFDVAGFSVGIGEWRPQRDGSFGRFHVARGDE